MSTIREILVDSERRLSRAGIDSASVESAQMLAHVLGVPRNRLLLQDHLEEEHRITFERLMAQRLNRIPLQHLLGKAPFRYLELAVGPGVFIPRPETELVAEAAIRHLRACDNPRAFDLCAGSGAIALSMATEVPGAQITAVELSEDALPWITQNIKEVATDMTVALIAADATDLSNPLILEAAGTCDVVTCNPPYIPTNMVPRDPEVRDHEPSMALYGGQDGLEVVRGIVMTAGLLLKRGGLLVIEHADVQGPESVNGGVVAVVREAVVPAGMAEYIAGVPGTAMFTDIDDRQDYNQLPRFTMALRA